MLESWQNIQANRVQALAKLELWERVVEEATRLIGIAARPARYCPPRHRTPLNPINGC